MTPTELIETALRINEPICPFNDTHEPILVAGGSLGSVPCCLDYASFRSTVFWAIAAVEGLPVTFNLMSVALSMTSQS